MRDEWDGRKHGRPDGSMRNVRRPVSPGWPPVDHLPKPAPLLLVESQPAPRGPAVDVARLDRPMSGIEAVLAAHRWNFTFAGPNDCLCGWCADLNGDPAVTRQHRAHVAAEIAAWLLADEQVQRGGGGIGNALNGIPFREADRDERRRVLYRAAIRAVLTAVLGGGGGE